MPEEPHEELMEDWKPDTKLIELSMEGLACLSALGHPMSHLPARTDLVVVAAITKVHADFNRDPTEINFRKARIVWVVLFTDPIKNRRSTIKDRAEKILADHWDGFTIGDFPGRFARTHAHQKEQTLDEHATRTRLQRRVDDLIQLKALGKAFQAVQKSASGQKQVEVSSEVIDKLRSLHPKRKERVLSQGQMDEQVNRLRAIRERNREENDRLWKEEVTARTEATKNASRAQGAAERGECVAEQDDDDGDEMEGITFYGKRMADDMADRVGSGYRSPMAEGVSEEARERSRARWEAMSVEEREGLEKAEEYLKAIDNHSPLITPDLAEGIQDPLQPLVTPMTPEDMLKRIRHAAPAAHAGSDGLGIDMLKELVKTYNPDNSLSELQAEMVRELCHYTNTMHITQKVPDKWLQLALGGELAALPKDKPGQIRPINMCDCLRKLADQHIDTSDRLWKKEHFRGINCAFSNDGSGEHVHTARM